MNDVIYETVVTTVSPHDERVDQIGRLHGQPEAEQHLGGLTTRIRSA